MPFEGEGDVDGEDGLDPLASPPSFTSSDSDKEGDQGGNVSGGSRFDDDYDYEDTLTLSESADEKSAPTSSRHNKRKFSDDDAWIGRSIRSRSRLSSSGMATASFDGSDVSPSPRISQIDIDEDDIDFSFDENDSHAASSVAASSVLSERLNYGRRLLAAGGDAGSVASVPAAARGDDMRSYRRLVVRKVGDGSKRVSAGRIFGDHSSTSRASAAESDYAGLLSSTQKRRRSGRRRKRAKRSNPEIERLIGKAHEHYIDCRYKEAIDILENVVRREPANKDAYPTMGLIYEQTGEKLKALSAYKMCVSLNSRKGSPTDFIKCRSVARIAMELGRFQEALKYFMMVARNADQVDADLLLNMGDLLSQQIREPKRAFHYYKRALQMMGGENVKDLHIVLTVARGFIAAGKVIVATKLLKKHLDVLFGVSSPPSSRGGLYVGTEDNTADSTLLQVGFSAAGMLIPLYLATESYHHAINMIQTMRTSLASGQWDVEASLANLPLNLAIWFSIASVWEDPVREGTQEAKEMLGNLIKLPNIYETNPGLMRDVADTYLGVSRFELAEPIYKQLRERRAHIAKGLQEHADLGCVFQPYFNLRVELRLAACYRELGKEEACLQAMRSLILDYGKSNQSMLLAHSAAGASAAPSNFPSIAELKQCVVDVLFLSGKEEEAKAFCDKYHFPFDPSKLTTRIDRLDALSKGLLEPWYACRSRFKKRTFRPSLGGIGHSHRPQKIFKSATWKRRAPAKKKRSPIKTNEQLLKEALEAEVLARVRQRAEKRASERLGIAREFEKQGDYDSFVAICISMFKRQSVKLHSVATRVFTTLNTDKVKHLQFDDTELALYMRDSDFIQMVCDLCDTMCDKLGKHSLAIEFVGSLQEDSSFGGKRPVDHIELYLLMARMAVGVNLPGVLFRQLRSLIINSPLMALHGGEKVFAFAPATAQFLNAMLLRRRTSLAGNRIDPFGAKYGKDWLFLLTRSMLLPWIRNLSELRRDESGMMPVDPATDISHTVLRYLRISSLHPLLSVKFARERVQKWRSLAALDPKSPLVFLGLASSHFSIGICTFLRAKKPKHAAERADSFKYMMCALAHLKTYERLRLVDASEGMQPKSYEPSLAIRAEIAFNFAFAHHIMGIHPEATSGYVHVLKLIDNAAERNDATLVQLRHKTAHHLSIIVGRESRNQRGGIHIVRKYLTYDE